ncbi:hypothetical protein [Flavobacterium sp.]|uniref:hypothetical protein n=1 Tax=Flavobacterium sp. TaxID=239 RepID=UPI002603A12F|nr:hypothetical protein [Flavobacterium sp.]
MKLTFIFVFLISAVSAQNKKINFFGTEFPVNNSCEVKESSAKYDKNAMIWTAAPPKIMRGTMVSMIKNKLQGKKLKELKTEPLKVTLLKNSWEGKRTEYKKEGNDSITNFVQLYGQYKDEERLLIIMYKTAKSETFRIPAYFDFLVK